MSINRSNISAQPIIENDEVAIEMKTQRPDETVFLDPPVRPRTLVGWYDPISDQVELYVTNQSGTRYHRIR